MRSRTVRRLPRQGTGLAWAIEPSRSLPARGAGAAPEFDCVSNLMPEPPPPTDAGETGTVEHALADQERAFLLGVVQPGLAGLMDGSVSSLAPVFAAALASRSSRMAFLVGLATAVGAGISMAFSEALSDDGKLSGRGNPWLRGAVCGGMTFAGAIGHTLPFLISNFQIAAVMACLVVVVELLCIAWIRHRYMDTPLGKAIVLVIVGGLIVFLAGVIIGSA